MKLVHASTTASSSSAMLEKHGSTHSIVTLDTFVSTRSTRDLVCCVYSFYKVIICKLFTNLLEYTLI